MVDSILDSVKDKLSGVYVDDGDPIFDDQLIDYINSVFTDLFMLGYGPDPVYQISGYENTWDEYITDPAFNDIKTYVAWRAKLMFDPPQNSALLSNYKEQVESMEFMIKVKAGGNHK